MNNVLEGFGSLVDMNMDGVENMNMNISKNMRRSISQILKLGDWVWSAVYACESGAYARDGNMCDPTNIYNPFFFFGCNYKASDQ